jgi:DNA-directed RNA polymerase beta' subunit
VPENFNLATPDMNYAIDFARSNSREVYPVGSHVIDQLKLLGRRFPLEVIMQTMQTLQNEFYKF